MAVRQLASTVASAVTIAQLGKRSAVGPKWRPPAPKWRPPANDVRTYASSQPAKVPHSGFPVPSSPFQSPGIAPRCDTFAESQADLYVKFRYSDKYKNKDDKTRALFGAPGSTVPGLFEIADPRLKQSKRPDGFYSWRAWGLLRVLRFDPAPAGAAGPRGPGMGLTPPGGGLRGFMPNRPPAPERAAPDKEE